MATITEILSGILNPNPGAGGLLSQAGYLQQTGLGPEQLARYHQASGMGAMPAAPQAAPPGAITPQQQAPMPVQPQSAPAGPSGGGIGGLLSGLFGGGANAGKNETIQWLQQQGMDPGTATLMAGNKQALQQYLLQRSQGQKPLEVNGRLVDPNTYQVLADFSDGEKSEATASMREYEYAKRTGAFNGSFTDWQTKGIREQDPTFQREMDLRQQYDMLPEVKDYKVVRSNFERIQQGVKLGTGAGDAAIVFGYMKMLDPTSVVREGEQATTRNAAGVPEAVRGMYNQLIGGGQLSGEARNQILQAAQKVYGESSANIEELNTRYSGFATNYNLDPSRVVSPIEQYEPFAPAGPAPGGGLPLPPPQGAPAPAAPAAPVPQGGVTDWKDWLKPKGPK